MTESEIFNFAIKLTIGEREDYLQQVCGDNAQLIQRVRDLLQAHASIDATVDLNPTASVQSDRKFQGASPTKTETQDLPPTIDSTRTSGSMGLRGGEQIGPFTLRKPLGRGGMGEVWMAEQFLPVKRLVALKVIKRGIGSKEILARFDAERQALALMNHNNIARILDAGTTTDGQPYFAMELVQGKPLTTFCDENELSIDERLALFRDVCSGVQHAHQKGIIHRDLKPGNILVTMVDGKPIAKVIDFGLAKAMESTSKLTDKSLFTGIGQILGTLKYMSPEQASLDSVDIDTRTDIYSLGVILYELLTGTTPLESSSIKEMAVLQVLEFVRDREPVKPSSRISSSSNDEVSTITGNRKTDSTRLNRALVGDLDWIVMKALEKDRTRRYESASGFAADVLRFLNSEPVIARPPSLNYRIKKFVRKNRVGVVSATLVVLALVVGIVGTTLGLFRAVSAEALATKRLIESEKNLSYAKKGNEILGAVFSNLDSNVKYTNVAELRNTLRDNLQTAAEQLDGAAIGDPLVVTEMQMTLAKSLISLSETSLAVKLLEKARDTRISHLGLEHADTLTIMHALAFGYLEGGETEKALALYQQTWELRESLLGKDHIATLNTMGSFASALLSNGQIEKALPLLEQSMDLSKSKLGQNSLDTFTSINNLATAYHSSGRLDKALPLYEQAADLRKSNLGPTHPHTLSSICNLAWAQIDAGQVESASQLFKQTLEIQISTLGADHTETMYTMSGLAATYEETAQLDKAIALYERTLDLMKLKLGNDHPDTLTSMNNLAGAYYRNDQLEKTLPLYEQSIESMTSKLGPEHPATLLTINNLALAYKDSGDFDKAFPLFEQSMQGMENLNFKSQFVFSIFPQSLLAYEYAKRFEEADARRSKWQAFVKGEFGEESVQFANELNSHGHALLMRNEPKKANPILRRCLAIREKLEPNSWSTFNTQSLLGVCLLNEKEYADAEPQLLASFEGLKSQETAIPPDEAACISRTLESLIELYSALEQPENRDRFKKLREAYPANQPLQQ